MLLEKLGAFVFSADPLGEPSQLLEMPMLSDQCLLDMSSHYHTSKDWPWEDSISHASRMQRIDSVSAVGNLESHNEVSTLFDKRKRGLDRWLRGASSRPDKT